MMQPTRFTQWHWQNPQLFREFKGRLTPGQIAIATVTSLGLQALFLLPFLLRLPTSPNQVSTYCAGSAEVSSRGHVTCAIDPLTGQVLINWAHWWGDLVSPLALILLFVMLVGGTYLLASDLHKEQTRGTLEFIRLSPQSSQTMLLGKLLGVPILLYLGVGLALPLLLWGVWASGAAIWVNLSWGLLAGVMLSLFFVGSMALVLGSRLPGWRVAIAVLVSTSFFGVLLLGWRGHDVALIDLVQLCFGDHWWHVPVGTHHNLALLFTLATLSAPLWLAWRLANRCLRTPNLAPLSKGLSYQATLILNFWLLGFAIHSSSRYAPEQGLGWVLVAVNLIWLCSVVMMMTPSRQVLIDWARYQHLAPQLAPGRARRTFWRDRLLGEKSPTLLAIALNSLLTLLALSLSALVVAGQIGEWPLALNARLLSYAFSLLALLGAVLGYLLTLLSSSRRLARNHNGVFLALLLLPPQLLLVLGLGGALRFVLPWLFTIFAWPALEWVQADSLMFEVAIALLGHFSLLRWLTVRWQRRLQQVGQSEWLSIDNSAISG